jgi:hypothetical protein
MSANSYVTPWVASEPPGSLRSRVAAARRLLASYLTPDHQQCADAIAVLGVDWLRQQGLAPLTWFTCQASRLPAAMSLPAAIGQPLQHAYYSAVGDADLHQRELKAVLRALHAHHIRPIIFKGAALCWSVYPDPACRPMGDLDLWINLADLTTAQTVLGDLGYRQVINPDRPPPLMEHFGGEIHMSGTGRDQGLIELHLSVFLGEWLRHTANVDEAAVRARAVSAPWHGEHVAVLSSEDAVLQLIVHLAINHQLSFFPLRSLVDIALLARHQPLDWNVVVQRARAWRVATATWLALSLAVDLAGLNEAAEAVQRLQPSALRRRLLGRFANPEALVALRNLSASRWRYVFLLSLVDRPRDVLKLIFRTLWPEREWLSARYGHYTLGTRVRHFFSAARGKI